MARSSIEVVVLGMHLVIKTDGGARGNPGPAGIGVVIEDEDGKVLEEHAKFLGVATNNVAEYKAVVLGLERAKSLGAATVEVRADSELLVKQANGDYRVKNEGLKPLYEKMKILETHFDKVRYRHVRREMNKAADALANRAMDRKSNSE